MVPRFAVGAVGSFGNENDSGRVGVYRLNTTSTAANNTYSQVGLDIVGEAAGDRFGRSVSLSADGTTLAVGATGHDGSNGTDSGHVRVYRIAAARPMTRTPSQSPTRAPAKSPTRAPVRITTTTFSPTTTPTASPENCGLFGWNLFCPRRGKCGWIKRLLNLGPCM